MGKKSLASKKESKQGKKRRNKPIKHFDSGVVSWSLFDEYWNREAEFRLRMEFLIRAGIETGEFEDAFYEIERIAESTDEQHNEFFEKGVAEKDQAGGNDIATIKDITERRRNLIA